MERRRNPKRKSLHTHKHDLDHYQDPPYASGNIRVLAREVEPLFKQASQSLPTPGSFPQYDQIQKWLAGTRERTVALLDSARQAESRDRSCLVSFGRHQERAGFESYSQAEMQRVLKEEDGVSRKVCGRRIKSASYSSLLELGFAPESSSGIGSVSTDDEQISSDGSAALSNKRRKVTIPVQLVQNNNTPSIESRSNWAFEKRRRHKTHEERYKPKKRKRGADFQAKPEQKRKITREKGVSRRKGIKKNVEHLMEKFSSTSVGQDRLTMRPSRTLGLFANGRASSPARRRGLPDLAFSEMEFLQRVKQPTAFTRDKKYRAKSREKDDRKLILAQNEISAYFKSDANILPAMGVVNKRSSYRKRTADNLREVPDERNKGIQHQSSCLTSISPSKITCPVPFLGFGHPKPVPDQQARTISMLEWNLGPEVATNANCRVSDEATTYCTWSDSPQITKVQKISSSKAGTTPYSVRRSIERTRIFDDNGIRQPKLRRNEQNSQDCNACAETSEPYLSHRSTSISYARKSGYQRANAQNLDSHSNALPRGVLSHDEYLISPTRVRTRPWRDQTGASQHGDTTMVNYCLQPERRRHTADDLAEQVHYGSIAEPTRRHPSRQEIAQGAYVKYVPALAKITQHAVDVEASRPTARWDNDAIPLHDDQHASEGGTMSQAQILSHCSSISGSGAKAMQRNHLATIQVCSPVLGEASLLHRSSPCSTRQLILEKSPLAPLDDMQRSDGRTMSASPAAQTAIFPNNGAGRKILMANIVETQNPAACHNDAASRQLFEGLPIRGSWPGQTATHNPDAIVPLYSHQLRCHGLSGLATLDRCLTPVEDDAIDGPEDDVSGTEIYQEDGFSEGLDHQLLYQNLDMQAEDVAFIGSFVAGTFEAGEKSPFASWEVGAVMEGDTSPMRHLYEDSHFATRHPKKGHAADAEPYGQPKDGCDTTDLGWPLQCREQVCNNEESIMRSFWRPFRQY